mmetsp:Transcript_18044/g.37010  ORF Transcript_18044/g.37010 Transcript_18044/m.37010 type:complete len:204 (+) Transcript_18044:955-1566(+)
MSTSEWPFKYLVAECTTRSAPRCSGDIPAGLRNVLSTTTSALGHWERLAATTRFTSTSFMVGLVGDSIQTMAVSGVSAEVSTASVDKSTNENLDVSCWSLSSTREQRRRVPPYTSSTATTFASPGTKRITVSVAASPLENVSAAVPPRSTDARHVSRASREGFPDREYIHFPKGFPGSCCANVVLSEIGGTTAPDVGSGSLPW